MDIRISGKRVVEDEGGERPLDGMGCTYYKYPEEGYLFTINLPGARPIYITKSDIARLEESEPGVEMKMESWGTKNEEKC